MVERIILVERQFYGGEKSILKLQYTPFSNEKYDKDL